MDVNQALSKKQQSIIPIAAFTANGDLEKLKLALEEGLAAGLTVNDERKEKGIKDEVGKEASPLPADMDRDKYGAEVRAKLAGWDTLPAPGGYQLFTPIMDTFLKERLFADIFARDVLDFQSRELVTISALASMTGTGGQLFFHLGAAMNAGLSEAQMQAFITVLKAKVGEKESESANEILTKVLSN